MRARSLSALAVVSTFIALACSGGHGSTPPEPGTPSGEATGTTPAAPVGATLSIKGSDTMVILAQRWAEGYMQSHPGTTIQVSGGGTGTGISALLSGTTDIADASRAMNEREIAQMQTDRHVAPHQERVALDALAVYVNGQSALTSLTLEQISQIFRGEITNWSAVGGPDAPIVLYSRENNSGTYSYFKEHVLGGADFASTAQTLQGTAAIINAISHDPNGIGYGGIGYAEGVRTLAIAGPNGAAPIAPSLATATDGTYPISRFLYMYTAGEPTGLAHDFIQWVVGHDGQAVIEDVGFYPLPTQAAVPPAPGSGATGGPLAPPPDVAAES